MTSRVKNILTSQRGISLLIVLIMVVVMGLAAGLAGSTWKTVVQRSKEAELLFRGEQYRRAIELYFKAGHGGQAGQLPSQLEDLLRDPRTPDARRYIRRLFNDPMTGEDFEIIRDQVAAGRIKGVRSTSAAEPFKKDGFPPAYEKFAGASSYKEWEFVFEPSKTLLNELRQGQKSSAGQTGLQEQTGQPGSSSPANGSQLPFGGDQPLPSDTAQ